MNDDISMGELINHRERFQRPDWKPKVDELVSRVVGKNVLVRDPRLINLVAKWKKQSNKNPEDSTPDNFLEDINKINELKQVFQ